MKNTILAAIFVVLGVCTVGYCADSTLQVKVGDSFTISQPENAGSTGYSWSEKIANQAVVEFQAKDVLRDAAVLPGASGTARFTFHAISPGATTITLELTRPWEKEKTAVKTYTVDVTVSP